MLMINSRFRERILSLRVECMLNNNVGESEFWIKDWYVNYIEKEDFFKYFELIISGNGQINGDVIYYL